MRVSLEELKISVRDDAKKRDGEIYEIRRRTHELASNIQSALLELTKAMREIGGLTSKVGEIDRWRERMTDRGFRATE